MSYPTFSQIRRPLYAVFVAAGLTFGAYVHADDRPLDVPYVPTPQAVVDRMLEISGVTAQDYVIDLGSGDGRISITAAQRYGARALGVDLNPVRVQEAVSNAKSSRVTDQVTFKNQDLFHTPIGEANVLTMYLLPSVNLQLRPRILQEMAPGSRVVSHAFDMQEWEPDRREMVDGKSIYLWIVPAQVAGTWRLQGELDATLDLAQNFQQVSGSAQTAGKPVELNDLRVQGDLFRFSLNGKVYSGRVQGDRITAEDGSSWTAKRL